jgi:hypothetical protein
MDSAVIDIGKAGTALTACNMWAGFIALRESSKKKVSHFEKQALATVTYCVSLVFNDLRNVEENLPKEEKK